MPYNLRIPYFSQWEKYDVERPDYEEYVSKLETRSRIDAELEAIRIQKEQEELAKKLAEEQAKLDTLKQQEEVDLLQSRL